MKNILFSLFATLLLAFAPSTAVAESFSTSCFLLAPWMQSACTVSFEATAERPKFDFEMVQAGSFYMGANPNDRDADNDEKPRHYVTITKNFLMGKYEVTQAQWVWVMGDNPSSFKGANLPVEEVSWDDCQTFIRKLNEMRTQINPQLANMRFDLPTEAEWEFAARGGNKSKGYKYSGSDNIAKVAWYCDNSNYKSHNVCTKNGNELGLYDMSGNVWEWCKDYFGGYTSSSVTDPQGPDTGSYRVCRGGNWNYVARYSRVSCRSYLRSNESRSLIGLRLVLRYI